MAVRATYDRDAPIATVELSDAPVVGTLEYDEDHLVDVDADRSVVSIEILDLEDPKIAEMAARFGFEDQVQAVTAALGAVLPRTPLGGHMTGITCVTSNQVLSGETLVSLDPSSGHVGRSASSPVLPHQEIDLVK